MIIDAHSGTRLDEVAPDIYRIHMPVPADVFPGGFSFNHFLIADDQPLLFHAGFKRAFPLLRQAIAAVLPPEKLRYIAYSHHEPDESNAVEHFLEIAPAAEPVCSAIGAMVAQGDTYRKPALGLDDGARLDLGKHKLEWVNTPHMPHGWDCGLLFDHTSGTLLCGDLFTQGGSDPTPVTEQEILSSSEAFRKPMDFYAHSASTGAVLDRLAALNPQLLACMHGHSYRGDGAAHLQGLKRALASGQ